MSEANETIFNNWKTFVYNEAERIVEATLEAKKYDSLHSKEWANSICEQVSIHDMVSVDYRETVRNEPPFQVYCELYNTGCGGQWHGCGGALLLGSGDGWFSHYQVG